jgi:hypothetical protein
MPASSGETAMDGAVALKFLDSFLPVKVSGKVALTSEVKLDLFNVKLKRLKVPDLQIFLNDSQSLPFRNAMMFQINQGKSVFIVYETYTTNKIKLNANGRADISTMAEIGKITPLFETSSEPHFTFTKTSRTEIVIDGDGFYNFGLKTAKLQFDQVRKLWSFEITNFAPAGVLAAGTDDKFAAALTGSDPQDFQVVDIIKSNEMISVFTDSTLSTSSSSAVDQTNLLKDRAKQGQAKLDKDVTTSLTTIVDEIKAGEEKIKPKIDTPTNQYYDPNEVIAAVNQGRDRLLSRIKGKELAGLRAYVKESYPTVSPSSFPTSRWISEESKRSAFDNANNFLTTLSSKLFSSDEGSTVDVRIDSDPTEANIQISADSGDNKETWTNSTITNVYRGRWHFRISKNGFVPSEGTLDLIDEKGNHLKCWLFRPAESKRSFCVRQ